MPSAVLYFFSAERNIEWQWIKKTLLKTCFANSPFTICLTESILLYGIPQSNFKLQNHSGIRWKPHRSFGFCLFNSFIQIYNFRRELSQFVFPDLFPIKLSWLILTILPSLNSLLLTFYSALLCCWLGLTSGEIAYCYPLILFTPFKILKTFKILFHSLKFLHASEHINKFIKKQH